MAIKFVDRVPTRPGRIKITPEDGSNPWYGVMERADEPSVEGTPINATNLNAMQQNQGMSGNMTVYVATSGSDALGDGTRTAPYATITKAISIVPKNLNGNNATINIAAGSYNENVVIEYFVGGRIIITGVENDLVHINELYVTGCDVLVSNVSISAVALHCTRLAFCNIATSLTIRSGATRAINISNFSSAVINSATIDGSTERAVNVSSHGMAYFNIIQGTNNSGVGLVVSGGIIMYYLSSLEATIATNTGAGGRIYSGAQTNIPNY